MTRRGTLCWAPFAFAWVAVGCVSRAEYERARTATRAEQAVVRQVSQSAHALSRRVETIEEKLARARTALEEADLDRAEAKLDRQVAGKRYQESTEMVAQLREELGRAGSHLRAFSKQKDDLAKRLEEAEQRSRLASGTDLAMAFIAGDASEIALAMPELLEAGVVTLSVRAAHLVVSAREAELWLGAQGILSPEGASLVSGLAGLAARDRDLAFEIGPAAAQGRAAPRRVELRDALIASGVDGARVSLVARIGATHEGADDDPSAESPVADAPDGRATARPQREMGQQECLDVALIRGES